MEVVAQGERKREGERGGRLFVERERGEKLWDEVYIDDRVVRVKGKRDIQGAPFSFSLTNYDRELLEANFLLSLPLTYALYV